MITIANPKYVDPANMLIDVDVTVDGFDGGNGVGQPFPFTFHPGDDAEITHAVAYALQGVAIAPYTAPVLPYVPIVVSASAAKMILDNDGIYTAVETICLAHEVNAVRIFWQSANTWREDNPYVAAIAVEMSISSEEIHNKFVRAAALDASL